LIHKNETPIKIHWQLLVFYGEDTVDISTVHHWVKKWSGMSVGATHNFNRQKYDKLIQENQSALRKP
jgi:hypothetical protein